MEPFPGLKAFWISYELLLLATIEKSLKIKRQKLARNEML
jgi:hypothetical protein